MARVGSRPVNAADAELAEDPRGRRVLRNFMPQAWDCDVSKVPKFPQLFFKSKQKCVWYVHMQVYICVVVCV